MYQAHQLKVAPPVQHVHPFTRNHGHRAEGLVVCDKHELRGNT